MKIMVIGPYGKAGQLIMQQALKRGHKVTGVAHRQHGGFDFDNIIIKSMLDLTKNDVKDFDAVVDAVGAWTAKTQSVHYDGLLHIINLLKGSQTRYLKVGGANTLFVNADHTKTLQQLPLYYPKYMQELCAAHAKGIELLRKSSGVNWIYVTPAYKFAPYGPYTGHYKIKGNVFEPAKNNDPKYGRDDYISYADYAKGIIDIIENGKYIHQQITLVSGDNPDPNQPW